MYGRADLGYVYSKSGFAKFHGVENGNGIGGGGSRLGFMGDENLGGGLKALFKFEWGTAADVGTGPTGARYSYVGVGGNFGQVTLGRNGTPSDLYMGATSPWGINGIEPINYFREAIGSGSKIVHGARWDNSIAYASPKFSGLDFMGIYSFGENVKQTSASKVKPSDAGRLGLGIRYANGPLYLSAIYHRLADDHSASPVGSGYRGWGIGGSYDFKVVKVYSNYFHGKANHNDPLTQGSDKQTTLSLGVGVPVSSAGTVVAEYAIYKDYEKVFGRNSDKAGKAVGYSVGYRHNLSKRTSLYTYITRIDSKEENGVGLGFDKTMFDSRATKQTNLTAGIVHLF